MFLFLIFPPGGDRSQIVKGLACKCLVNVSLSSGRMRISESPGDCFSPPVVLLKCFFVIITFSVAVTFNVSPPGTMTEASPDSVE